MLTKQHKTLIIKIFTVIMFILTSYDCFSQIFEFEQSPPSVKWRQINTEDFRLIYPVEIEKQAQFTANLLDLKKESIIENIRTKPRKISIILRNQSVTSNGFVQLSPRRSEFFITPPQDSAPSDWLESLAIHEYRHVGQIDKLTSKPPFELIGLAFFGVSLPPWVYEGDAVGVETELTSGGRGRLPSWEMPLRANMLSSKNYSYQKNYLGSMKDNTAGYYQLGYFITTKIKRDFDAIVLDSVFTRMSRMPIRPYNFSNSLKKFTKRSTQNWYTETMEDLHEKWESQLVKNKPLHYPLSYPTDSTIKNDFLLPQSLDQNHVLAISKNPKNTAAIVKIDSDGTYEEIIKTGRQSHPNFSYANDLLTWDEIRQDMRFHKQDYNVINTYNLVTKKYKQLSRKSRFFSPSLNRNATKIAAVDVAKNYEEFLVILDAQSGEEIKRIPAPQSMHLQTPSFHAANEKVITVGISNAGSSLIEFNLTSQTSRILMSNLGQQFERPIYANNKIIFKSAYNGIDNLYLYDPETNTMDQLTNIRYGAFNPSYLEHSNTLLFNNYQPYGFQISQVDLATVQPQPVSEIENTFINYFKPTVREDQHAIPIDTSENKDYSSTPYKEINNLFNFHSLSVGSDDFESIGDLKLGLLWLSDNLLNTLSVRVGAAYNTEVKRPEFSTTLTYQRYFPKFNLHYENSGKLSGIKLDENSDKISQIRWRENEIKFNIEIPLLFNRLNHVFHTGFKTGTSFIHRYRLSIPEINDRFIRKLKFPLDFEFYFNRNDQRSQMDLAPKWGQNISFFYRTSAFEKNLSGKAFSIRSSFYFPGLSTNHSLRTRLSFQKHSGSFQYTNYIPMVNGYDQMSISIPESTFLVDYRFPIAYPDWELGKLAYIQRLKGGFFTHYENFAKNKKYGPRTMGVELRADVNLLRFFLPIFDLGVKTIYVNEPNDKKWLFEFGFAYSY